MPNGMDWLEKEASELGLRITRGLKLDLDAPVEFCLLLFAEGQMVHYSTVKREVLLKALKKFIEVASEKE